MTLVQFMARQEIKTFVLYLWMKWIYIPITNIFKMCLNNSKILYALWMFVNKYFITWQKLSFLIDHIGYAVCLLRCFICLYFDVNKFEKKRLRSHLWLFTTEFKFKLWLLKAIRPVRTNNKLVLYSIWMPLLITQQFVQFANT